MKSIGIITIHGIHNVGSVLQTFALWYVLSKQGYDVEIIDYQFPNDFHNRVDNDAELEIRAYSKISLQEKLLKILYAKGLLRQHGRTDSFLKRMSVKMSANRFSTREAIMNTNHKYDVYITGSDQVWNPRYTKGDDVFLLSFAPDDAIKISYAASFGTKYLPQSIKEQYAKFIKRYDHLSVREASGIDILKNDFNRESLCVFDPTLLLNADQWRSVLKIPATSPEKPYIFCYLLNYSFDAFPFAETFAYEISRRTGLRLIFGGRPPRNINLKYLTRSSYRVGIGPEEFVSYIANAKLVITTSFHGTAFSVNMGTPVYSIVDPTIEDDRQAALLKSVGLSHRVIEMNSSIPNTDFFDNGGENTQVEISKKRSESLSYLFSSIKP